jgi:predicted PurR-regulated permease PerM
MPRALTSPQSFSQLVPWVTAILSIVVLYSAREVLIPLASAILLTFLLAPAIGWLERRRLPRVPAVLVVLLFSLSMLSATGWIVSNQLLNVINQLPAYTENIQQKLNVFHGSKGGILSRTAATVEELGKELTTTPPNQVVPLSKGTANTSKPAAAPHPVPVEVVSPPANALQSARDILGPIAGVFGALLMVIVFAVFMLMKREDLRNRLIRLVAKDHLNVVTQAMDDAGRRVSRYLLMQFVVNTAFGIAVAGGLYFIGLPNALLWGALGATLRFFPFIGPLIAGTLPFILALTVFSDWTHPLMAAGLFLGIELITANLVEPRLYGAHTGISSLAILVAAVFWTVLWGPVGLILSTPLTVCLVVLGRYVPQLEFLHILLGDEPVLSAESRFYQRLLAMDQPEAQAVCEAFVKEKCLIDLYDEVVIPALAMAEQDRQKGLLKPANEAFIVQSINELIVELTYAQPSEPARLHGTRVICVPANDHADEITATMLAQLVEQAGHPTISLPLAGSTLEIFEVLESYAGDVVCVCALPPFALLHARTLSKQLRSRFPDMKILIGIWSVSDANSERLKERLAKALSDPVVTTLREALEELNGPGEEALVTGGVDFSLPSHAASTARNRC